MSEVAASTASATLLPTEPVGSSEQFEGTDGILQQLKEQLQAEIAARGKAEASLRKCEAELKIFVHAEANGDERVRDLELKLRQEERAREALDALVEVSDGRVLPLHADGEPSAELHDGDLLLDGRRTWRVLRPEAVEPTIVTAVLVAHPEAALELNLAARSATFTVGTQACRVRGAPVLAMAPYALARRDGPRDEGGWLTLPAAHAWWVTLGGPSASPPERLNWERAKLRSMLAREGGHGVDALFEVRRRVGETTIRLALDPERIDVGGED